MSEQKFRIISENIKDTSEVKKGNNIYYKCTKCGDIIPSKPNDNIGCQCGNVFIDIDYHRLSIDNYDNFQVLSCK